MFRNLVAEKKIERAPILEVCRKQSGERSSSRRSPRMSEQAPFYIFTAFIFAYGTTTLHASRDLLLMARARRQSACRAITIPLSGYVSDLIGRKKMYIIGAATMGVFGFIYFGLIDTGSSVLIFIAMVLSLIPHDMQYGPQAALIAESFTPRLRYSGASIGYQLASITAGGPAPLIATALFATYKSGTPIAIYILITAVDLDHRDRVPEGLYGQGRVGRVRRRRQSPPRHVLTATDSETRFLSPLAGRGLLTSRASCR